MLAIGAFNPHQRAQHLGVVIEPAVRFEGRIQCIFSGVAEGRMANIMGQAQRLGQVLVQPQGPGNHAADLRHFQAVGQPDAVMIAIRGDKDLGLVAQAAKGDRMDDPITVTLEFAARTTGQCAFECKLATARPRRIRGEGCPHAAASIHSTAASA